MNKYIECDALIEYICADCGWDGICKTKCVGLKMIRDFPAADVAPVVRCKDCGVPHNYATGCPKLNGLVPPPEFYCAYGAKMEEK